MKYSTGVITGALVVVLAACGSSAPKNAASPAARASTTAAGASAAATPAPNLNAELLAIGDLPAGWSVVPSSDSNAATPQCLQNLKSDLKPASKAEVTFTDGSNGVPLLDEGLNYLPGEGKHAMAEVGQILSGCGQISISSGGTTLTGTVGAMSYPGVGDQSAAWQMNLSATVSGITITFGIDLVLFRKGDTVALILYGDLGTPDINALQQYVQAAAAKVS